MSSEPSEELSLVDSTNNGSRHGGHPGLRRRRRPTDNNKPTTSSKKVRKVASSVGISAAAGASDGVVDDKKKSSKELEQIILRPRIGRAAKKASTIENSMVVAQKKKPTRSKSTRKAAKDANIVSNSQCYIYLFIHLYYFHL